MRAYGTGSTMIEGPRIVHHPIAEGMCTRNVCSHLFLSANKVVKQAPKRLSCFSNESSYQLAAAEKVEKKITGVRVLTDSTTGGNRVLIAWGYGQTD